MGGEHWSSWAPVVRRGDRDDEPGLPIKLAPCSNGEFVPPPASAAFAAGHPWF